MKGSASSSRLILRVIHPHSTAIRPSPPSRSIRAALPGPSSIAPQPQIRSSLPIRATRTFFSLPDISKLAGFGDGASKEEGGIETDGEEQRFHARKILPYTQAQLYSIVSDVPKYSSFIPFCTTSRVLPSWPTSSSPSPATEWKPSDQPFDVHAELTVGFGGLQESYVSQVVGRPFESVTATASKQTPLFKSLITTWSFTPASSLSPHPSDSTTRDGQEGQRLPNDTRDLSPKEGPTLLAVDMAFSFANPLHRIASQAVLPKVADKMVEAFERRCVEVWGKGKD